MTDIRGKLMIAGYSDAQCDEIFAVIWDGGCAIMPQILPCPQGDDCPRTAILKAAVAEHKSKSGYLASKWATPAPTGSETT